ncbi:MAG: RsmE family RNA methyltransferase [Actinomycetota bacterium]
MSGLVTGFEVRRAAATHVLLDDIGAAPSGGDGHSDLTGAVSGELADDLPDPIEHHLRSVLRIADGAAVTVTDGRGAWRPARAIVDRASLRLESDGPIQVEPRRSPPLTIAAAIPKGDRVDVMVQKATELGVDELILLHADRSVVRWKPERVDRHRARLQRVADEATRQSRRVWRTSVVGPFRAVEVISGQLPVPGFEPAVNPSRSTSPALVIAEPGGRPITSHDRRIAVGPEGGWSDAELSATTERVGIGENILRIETAVLAIAALSVVSNH